MIDFNKDEIKNALTLENIFDLLVEWGAEPEYTPFGILSSTICHNEPGNGSRKLYFYENSGLFRCYTGCDCYFDIFELLIKIAKIQWHEDLDLNDAIRWVAYKFGIAGSYSQDTDKETLEDWKYLANYERIQDIEIKNSKIILKEYDPIILSRFNYDIKIGPWIDDGIGEEAIQKAQIGFYPGGNQITIPHFDVDGRFVGLRGRTLATEDAEKYGKYRPLRVNRQMYNHPLGMNLYNLNRSKDNIRTMKKAFIFEGEKSTLLYQTYFGFDNDISTACCGSSISSYQIQLLLDAGAEEIIIGFDRQFKEIGDEEFQHLKKNLIKIWEKYKNYAVISFLFDKNMTLGYKASPVDEGSDKFLKLYEERIIL